MSILNKAIQFHNNNNLEEAEIIYKKIIKQDKKNFNALCLLGTLQVQKRNYHEGIINLKKSLEIYDKNFIAINNLGLAYFSLENFNLAEKYFLKSIEINQNYFESYNNLGNIFLKKKKYLNALRYYKKCLSIKNDFNIALLNIAKLLVEIKKYKLSEKILNKVKTTQPQNAEIYFLKGIIEKRNFKNDSALENFLNSINLKPDYCEAYNEIGFLYYLKKDFDKAEYNLKKAIKIDGNFYGAKFNIGWIELLKENFKEGWKNYRYRKKINNSAKILIKIPELDNLLNLKDKKLFIYSEQGLGDIIQFYRYILLLAKKTKKIFFQVPSSLKYILSSNESCIELVNDFDKLPQCDFQCSLLDLPQIFETNIHNIPHNIPYISIDENLKQNWSNKLNKKKFKIGICWQTGKKIDADHLQFAQERSFNLKEFEKIALLNNVELISLQINSENFKNNEIFKNIKFFKHMDHLQPFMDSAAIIENCNLIISCDTSIVHLSGALGKETILILNYNNDWRWGLNRDKSIWYKNIKILRQVEPGSWKEPFDKAYEIIINKINEKN